MGLESITIGTAKWLTTKNGLQGCMIVAIKDGEFKGVSYGADMPKCRQLGKFLDASMELVESGSVRLTSFETMPSFLTQD
jgi:hypothetical protein